jgi:hypothetical protein
VSDETMTINVQRLRDEIVRYPFDFLDPFDFPGIMDILNKCRVSDELSPHPTPNLDLLRRFAKVAGWESREHASGKGRVFCIPQGVEEPSGTTRYLDLYFPDDLAAERWIDSFMALDAAAIVAVRKGGGIKVTDDKILKVRRVIVFDSCESAAAVRHGAIDEMTNPRMAVECCVQAFEEKP